MGKTPHLAETNSSKLVLIELNLFWFLMKPWPPCGADGRERPEGFADVMNPAVKYSRVNVDFNPA